MKKKIFITGITSDLIIKFLSFVDFSNYEVIGLSRNPKCIKLNNMKIIKGNILDIHKISDIIGGCDMIIHAAAITHSFKATKYSQINLEATRQLVDIAKSSRITKFVFVSSNVASNESGAYGLSKLLAEKYIQKQLKNWTIFRPSEIFGKTKKEGLDKLIDKIIEKPFVFCPLGMQTNFFPIHLDDAAQIMYRYTFDDEQKNKIIVVAGEREFSFLDIIKLTKIISKSNVKIVFVKKEIMFLIKKATEFIPLYLGVIPDQISRLYSKKNIENLHQNLIEIETYIEKLVKDRIDKSFH